MYRTKYNLSIETDIHADEVEKNFCRALKDVEGEYLTNQYTYYQVYIRHLLGLREGISVQTIINRLEYYRTKIKYKIFNTCYTEKEMVKILLLNNKYISKKTSPLGATVKLFRTMFHKDDAIVKTYIFDPNCLSLKYSMKQSFEDEVLFQYYASEMSKELDFICPKIYSCGKINNFKFKNHEYKYCCLFIIMEYIPGLTLAESSYNKETMKQIYEKINAVNREMISVGIHHNDLHSNNIILLDKSPLPEIIVLDFGEASIGPKRPLFRD